MNPIFAFSTQPDASRFAPIAAGHAGAPSAAAPRLDALDLASLGLGGRVQPWHAPAFDIPAAQTVAASGSLATLIRALAALREGLHVPQGEVASA